MIRLFLVQLRCKGDSFCDEDDRGGVKNGLMSPLLDIEGFWLGGMLSVVDCLAPVLKLWWFKRSC